MEAGVEIGSALQVLCSVESHTTALRWYPVYLAQAPGIHLVPQQVRVTHLRDGCITVSGSW
jgi:hypothetical protein